LIRGSANAGLANAQRPSPSTNADTVRLAGNREEAQFIGPMLPPRSPLGQARRHPSVLMVYRRRRCLKLPGP
ncbi:MAG: hypothetical protein QGG00_09920, partial [Verrucomicrobiota bacterium]|nr:hypothetical protein [Verrucomicrobiota bacterium]